jgi:biotin transport system substrate-specific component
MKEPFMNTRQLTRCALAAALMAVCAWIHIPAVIPVTLQSFAVFLMLGLLGGRLGTTAIGIYLLLGILGLPVFSGMRGGIAVLLGPTGGYLTGFFLSGLIFRLLEKVKFPVFPAMLLAMTGCYLFGTAWYWLAHSGGIDLWAVASTCVLPFLIPDGLKIGLAWYLAQRMKRYIN